MLKLIAIFALLVTTGSKVTAQSSYNPVIAPFGRIAPAPDAAMQPDRALDYRVVFSITKAAAEPSKVNPGLDKVARYLNLLASAKVNPKRGNIIAIVHGPATDLVLDHPAYRAKHGLENPNIALIDALARAGAQVHVCSQALAGQKIPAGDVSPLVTIDLSALTTLTTLQLKGWSVMTD